MTLLFGPVISPACFLANSKVYKCFLMDMLDHTLENSEDKDGDASDGCLAESQDLVVAAQSLPIVEEDGSLGSGEDQTAVADLVQTQGLLDTTDEDVQYQFRSQEGSTVTYRVVQLGGAGDSADSLSEIVTAAPGFSATAGVQQAVLTNPINGQFYVIGSQEMLCAQSPRSLAPRASRSTIQIEKSRGGASRDDRRRATHNEVERRRRDKINNWIIRLSKIIPDCSSESAKAGQSKGGILAKACEYITDLRTSNQRLAESAKDKEALAMEMELLRQQNEELKRENAVLRSQLTQQGILPPSPELHVT
ncbi:Uncharacterized protein GBIM_15518 [Gryllus bimaculatus]|nr:Uncharacterized protein GBIM_15518 [Gryllus bimaculatus]